MHKIAALALTEAGIVDMIHMATDADNTVCHKRRKPGEPWPQTNGAIDCPHCVRLLAREDED